MRFCLSTVSALNSPALSGVIFGAGVKLGPAINKAGEFRAAFLKVNEKKRRYLFE